LEAFKLVLKAKWRFLNDLNSVWHDLLSCRYGNLCDSVTDTNLGRVGNQQSLWWRVLTELSYLEDNKLDWFADGVKLRLGNGLKANLGRGTWLGSDCLMQVFPHLYALAADWNCSVADAGFWSEGIWRWSLSWRRTLLRWEESFTEELFQLLHGISPNCKIEDSSILMVDPVRGYTVKSGY